MKKTGLGAAIFIFVLLLIAFRNDDGDWFTPDRRSTVETPSPTDLRFNIDKSDQVMIVATDSWGATHATAALWERQKDGSWKNSSGDSQARIGRNGFSENRSEGDGTTPAGRFRLTAAFGSAEESSTNLPYSQVAPTDCWISDTRDASYNQWTSRENCTPPNVNMYQRAQENGVYAHAVVIDFNTGVDFAVGKGSAIFLYRNELLKGSRSTSTSTSGGVTLSESDLMEVFRKLDEDAHPVIVMGPLKWIVGPRDTTAVVDGEKVGVDPGPDGAG